MCLRRAARRMMTSGITLALGGVLGYGTGSVRAQYPPTMQRAYTPPPAFSPYLNLNRPGNVGVNYYGIVRPEVNFRNALGNIQQDLNSVGTANDPLTNPPAMLTTGHSAQFNNLSHYYGGFNRLNGGGVRGSNGGGYGVGAGGLPAGGLNRAQGIQAPAASQPAGRVPAVGGR